MDDYTAVPATAADLIGSFRALLSGVLSSDPGTTAVDVGGCYVAPFADLLDALASGDIEARDTLAAKVLAIEEILAHESAAPPAAVRPVRTVTSLEELSRLTPNSIVCSAWSPADTFQNGADGLWYEPGLPDALPAEAVWEYMTGCSDTAIILDEDREVWVLYDAAVPVHAPRRAEGSHGFLTMANAGRAERFVTHATLAEARSVIEELCSRPGGAPAALAIRYRTSSETPFRGLTPVSAGTTLDLLPWRFRELVRALASNLGPTLTAALAGERDRSVIDAWCRDGSPEPSAAAFQRLQCADAQWKLIEGVQGADTARLWFIGMNPRLSNDSPVEAIMEGRFTEVEAAARAMVGGEDFS